MNTNNNGLTGVLFNKINHKMILYITILKIFQLLFHKINHKIILYIIIPIVIK